jgi:hypothetical protein
MLENVRPRRLLVVMVVVALVVTTGVLIALGQAGWVSGWGQGDRIAWEAVLIGAATFILTIVGEIVALAAFFFATDPPDLAAEFSINGAGANPSGFGPAVNPRSGGGSNPPRFRMAVDRSSGVLFVADQTRAQVRIHNWSKNAARNPALRIDLHGLYMRESFSLGWQVVAGTERGITAIQWDGEANLVIHGRWTRVLPPLDFGGMAVWPDDSPPELVLTLVADGFNGALRLPVEGLLADGTVLFHRSRDSE